MLCAKCHNNEATIHLTTMVDGQNQKNLDLCKTCAPLLGFGNVSLEEIQALSVVGKKCEFCGKRASSGEMLAAGGAIYWCVDCGVEFRRIFADLIKSERPDLMDLVNDLGTEQESEEGASSFITRWDSETKAWSEAAQRKAVQLLKERKRQDGRDKPS